MRVLILIAAIAAIWLILWYHRSPAPQQSEPETEPEALPDDGREARERQSLGKTLTDAADFFRDARQNTDAEQTALTGAIDALIERCDGLRQRIDADDGSARPLRQPLLRLLLPLNGVVRRAARASHRTASAERDVLLSASADAIARAADQLGQITERADEVALQRLEVDLEVLETRLGNSEV